jgi:hypothetical protein
VAAAAQHHSVAEYQDWLLAEVEVRHQPGGQRDLFADDAVVAEVDPGLAEDGALREGQPRAVADTAEPHPARPFRGHRPGLLEQPPAMVHGARQQPAPPGAHE